MSKAEFGEFAEIDFQQFLSKSNQLQCKVIGFVTSISKHRKYIIEVMLNKKAVIRTYKRFTEFQYLYDLLKYKFPTYSLQEFPSKFQIFGKDETRKSFFQNLLNQIVKDYAKQNTNNCHEIMKILFNFFTDHILQDKLRKDLIDKNRRQALKDKDNLNDDIETDAKSENGKRIVKKIIQESFNQEKPIERRHRASVDLSPPVAMIMRTRSNSACEQQKIINEAPQMQQNVYDNEFEIKFANEQTWKTGYIEIKDSTMFIFKNKLDNHFKTCIELYRINVEFLRRDMNLFDHFCEKMQCDLTRTFNQNEEILSLNHDYDHYKILIRKPCPENVSLQLNRFNILNLKDQIVEASYKQPNFPHFEGVFNPIGKIFVFFHRIKCNWKKVSEKEKVWLRIKTGAFIHHTTPVSYSNQLEINQGFLLPISSTFQRVRIECYTGKDKKDTGGNIIGAFKFNMVEFYTKLERSLIEKLEVNLEDEQNKGEFQTKLEVSLQNLSDFSSIYSNSYSNELDGTVMKPVSGLDDLEDFSISINRILNVLGNVMLFIRAFKRNVIKFKYPILGYAFFTWVTINVAFIPITYIIRELLVLLLFAILYQQHHVNIVIKYLMNKYIFQYIHPSFRPPQVLSTGEITHLKWSHQLEYIVEDYEYRDGKLQKKSDKPRSVYKFSVHDQVFTVKDEEQSFFEKLQVVGKILDTVYQVVNTLAFILEKVANLFSWVDFRKTVFLCMLILICTGFASSTVIQLIICCVCAANLINGTAYYDHKLYEKNRRFAVYSLRYILQRSFPEIIGAKNIHKNMNYVELNEYIGGLIFPIADESAQKKLRVQMGRIMGVYLEVEPVLSKVVKQNQLKLVYLIDMIETCEQKLKLSFIAGEQSLTNQFQQLKAETKEIQDIDDWLKESAVNFVLNIPSQFFMIFHRKQLHKIEKAEIRQNNPNTVKACESIDIPKKEESTSVELESTQSKELKMDEERKRVIEAEAAKEKILIKKQATLQ